MKKKVVLLLLFLCLISLVSAQTLKVKEGDLVKLKLSATDSDGDPLTYTFTLPLNDVGEWQTEIGDAGEYPITITVSDGKAETTKEITIVVEADDIKEKLEELIEGEPEDIKEKLEELVEEELKELIEDVPEDLIEIEPENVIEEEKELIEEIEIIEEFNNLPVLEDIEDIKINEGDFVKISPIASDEDNDPIDFSFSQPLNEKGEWQTQKGDAGSYKLTVIASDGKAIATKTFNIDIKALEKEIEFNKIEDQTINENELIEIELESEQGAVFSTRNLPEGSSLEENLFSWQPDYDFVNKNIFIKILHKLYIKKIPKKTITITFIAQVDDAVKEQIVSITVVDVNRLPILEPIEEIVVDENSKLELSPKYSDPDNDWLTVKYSGWIKKNVKFLNYEDSGEYKVNIKISDGIDSVEQEINIKVKDINRAPNLLPLTFNKIKEGELMKMSLKATDPEEDDLTFYIVNAPEGSEIKNDIFIWTPDYDFVEKNEDLDTIDKIKYFDKRFSQSYKETSIKLGVKDTANNTDERGIEVIVYNVNQAPEIISSEPDDRVIVARKAKLIFSVDVKEPDEDELTYKWNFGPFDSVEAGPKISRIFKIKGIKEIKVTISDGEKEIEKIWKVKVI